MTAGGDMGHDVCDDVGDGDNGNKMTPATTQTKGMAGRPVERGGGAPGGGCGSGGSGSGDCGGGGGCILQGP